MTPFEQFAIGFDQRDRARLHELWDQVLDSHRWTESRMVDRFERLWGGWNRLASVAFSSWSGAAGRLAIPGMSVHVSPLGSRDIHM